MFEKLDKVFYDGRPVAGFHQAEDKDIKHHHIGVEYADDKEPKNEVMHIEEWEQMKSEDQKKSENRVNMFQEATNGVQGRILEELDKFNPRWHEAIKIVQRVADRLNQIKEEFINEAYGTTDFMTKLTIGGIRDLLKKHDKDINTDGLSPFEVDFVELCIKHEITLDELNRMTFAKNVLERSNSWQEQALEAFMGVPIQNWRLDNIVQVLEAKYAEEKSIDEKIGAEKETLLNQEKEV